MAKLRASSKEKYCFSRTRQELGMSRCKLNPEIATNRFRKSVATMRELNATRWILCFVAVFAWQSLGVAQVPEQETQQFNADDVGPYRPQQTPELAKTSAEITRMTNAFRKMHDLEPVAINGLLGRSARNFAGFMARRDLYGHFADGNSVEERVNAHRYEACVVSENIAYQFRTTGFKTQELVDQIVEGWVRSPEHRMNMLDPDVEETGIAIAQSRETGIFYAVQLFGRHKTSAIEFTVANQTNLEVQYRVSQDEFSLPGRSTQTHWICRPAPLDLLEGQDVSAESEEFLPRNENAFAIGMNADGGLQLFRVK